MKKLILFIAVALLLSACNRNKTNIYPEKPVPGSTLTINVKSNEFAVIDMHFKDQTDSQAVINNTNGKISFVIPNDIYYVTYDIENNDSMVNSPRVIKIYNDSGKLSAGYYFGKGMISLANKDNKSAMDYFKKESDLHPSNYDAFFENLYITNAKINKDSIIKSLNDKYHSKTFLENTIIYYYKTGNIPLAQIYLNKFLKRKYDIDKGDLVDYITYYNRNEKNIITSVEKRLNNNRLKNNFLLNMFYYSVMDNNTKRANLYGNRYISADSSSSNSADVYYWLYRMHLKKLDDVLKIATAFPQSRYASRIFTNYVTVLVKKGLRDSAYSFAVNLIDSNFLPDFILSFGYQVQDDFHKKQSNFLKILNEKYSNIPTYKLRSYYSNRKYDYKDFLNKKYYFLTYLFDIKSRLYKSTGDNKNALKFAALSIKYLNKTDNDDTDVLDNYATLLFNTNHPDSAKSVAFNILSKSPTDTTAKNLISRIFNNNNVDSIIGSEVNKRLKASSLNIKAENFTVHSINGKTFTLSSLKGKIVVLNFWATWCGPCKLEIPFISKLPEHFSDSNVVFLAITDEDSARVSKFLKSRTFKYNVCFKGNDASKIYNIKAIPTHIIIDKNGYIRFKHVGYIPGIEKKIEMEINLLLK